MRVLKVSKSDFFIDNHKKASSGKIEPIGRPVFPFVGNKSNRRELIIALIMEIANKLLPELPNAVLDLFGGSFYVSHLIQIAAARLGHDITAYTNDYDNYTTLFTSETMQHLLYCKSVCDARDDLKRNEKLSENDCQLIDNYVSENCPYLDDWIIRFMTNYGTGRCYRKRLTDHQPFWNGVSLKNYVPNTVITLDKVDWSKWIDWVEKRGICDKTKPSLWFVDPPYSTYSSGIYYGDGYKNLDIDVYKIIKQILRKFPKAYIISFGYIRNFVDIIGKDKFPRNLHYDELNEYWPACQGLRVRSRPEYTHIWYIGKENLRLDRDLIVEKLIDKRNHGHIRADGKVPNVDSWTYDNKHGHF